MRFSLQTHSNLIQQKSELYNKVLFTVVNKDVDYENLGILPEDQGLNSNYVYLWGVRKDIPRILEHPADLQFLRIIVPNPDFIRDKLKPVGGGKFVIDFVPPNIVIEPVDFLPRYEE